MSTWARLFDQFERLQQDLWARAETPFTLSDQRQVQAILEAETLCEVPARVHDVSMSDAETESAWLNLTEADHHTLRAENARLRERLRAIGDERLVVMVLAADSASCPMPFALVRHEDISGVSGTGVVAHGVQFVDGTVVIRWLGQHKSTVTWDSLESAMAVHGHGGATKVVWLAEVYEPGSDDE